MVQRRKQNAPRKRSGCAACKRAHVRCPEERPACARCSRLGHECLYETKLLWEDDAAQRNIAHGRAKETVWSHKTVAAENNTGSSTTYQYQFLNTTVADFQSDPLSNSPESEHEEEEDDIEEVTRQATWSCIPVPPHSPYHGSDAFLLDYYINELSPKCSLSSSNNPYLYTLLPVAAEFAPLRHALLAAAANELRLQQHIQYEKPSLNLRDAAIKGLRTHLQSQRMDWKSLAVMLMFCFFDISDGCAPSWMTHLRMGLRMLQALRTETSTDHGLKAFCEIYFVAHDVMGQTAWDDSTLAVDHVWLLGDLQEIDVLMGCSRALISIIQRISCLSRWINQGIIPADESLYEWATMLDQLQCLEQHPAHGINDVEAVLAIAEAKRLAALLYLAEKLSAAITVDALDIDTSAIVQTLVSLLAEIPAQNAATLWPLFILGVSRFTSHEQHQFVLMRLLLLEQSRPLGSICHARRLVEAVAGGLTLDNDDGPITRSCISLA
ncbi:uncharacterized protein HMPREF1541_07901 [Cyphellophora europaea CBS 101466]|uniref:Zn(2)-C6 fungal-type domain-containing protein n=1 Tax=Cyphellophora europaea (strain CBS 101466) TaxID=1220924 RepID=W2RMH3_CYPE1|nr:uncharacterized protein HMPREF1541_07901 [Cyphellophora europaea CBS 101466]ETN36914.1 hypothetical protein HMPREF1541_07901 [Cyphellophora europaea CBS 101466]